jgi:DNA polymerase-3 subunit epsilon
VSLTLAVFDVETTGVNPMEDRIVSAFFGSAPLGFGDFIYRREFLINPGIDIPEGASEVHGITTKMVQESGSDASSAIEEISTIIQDVVEWDPNTVLAECRRHGVDAPVMDGIQVLDPFVVDKAIDPYRKGKRTLTATAQHYGIEVDESRTHDASYDCYLTLRVAEVLLQLPEVQRYMPGLHAAQVRWKRAQAASFEKYLRSSKNPNGPDPEATIDGGWPIMEEWTRQ